LPLLVSCIFPAGNLVLRPCTRQHHSHGRRNSGSAWERRSLASAC
jgi:hypothetical protein